MQRDRMIQVVCGLTLVTCVGISSVLSATMTAEAGRSQLTYTEQATSGDPPEVAVGVALGAFRGLFVNYLWLRATDLKEEGKFHEAIELSSAITRLQPRFPRVWSFHAWNMAYNISVATPSDTERWTWVKAGVELLRDEAIPRNPRSVLLHKELAWIFLHKIQGHSDDANRHYKREMAREWTLLLGPPPELPERRDPATKAYVDWFRPIAKAPSSLTGLIEQERQIVTSDPDWRESDGFEPTVDKLLEELRVRAGLTVSSELLGFVTTQQVFVDDWSRYVPEGRNVRNYNAVVNELMKDEQFERAWPLVMDYARKRVLIDEYNMEPERMLRYMQTFGPLDWRHPASHAIYWSTRGVEEGLGVKSVDSFDTLNTDRVTIHSIQELYRSGNILYDLTSNTYFTMTATAWIPTYGDMFETAKERGGIFANRKGYTTFAAGYENFLKDVIRNYWQAGEPQLARVYQERLITAPWLNENDDWMIDQRELPLDEFVKSQMRDRLSIPHVATAEVNNAIHDGFVRGLLAGDVERFQRNLDYAQWVHQQYFTEQDVLTTATKEVDRMERMSRSFRLTFAVAMLNTMLMLPPQETSEIWGKLSTDLQRFLYDPLVGTMATRGLTKELADRLFPEPPGMEEYRVSLQDELNAGDRGLKKDIQWLKQ